MDKFFQVKSVKETLVSLFSNWTVPDINIENIALTECHDRVLARDIYSNEDIPPYHRSTVDGYAVRAKDTFGASESLPALLQVVEEIAMGETPKLALSPGQAARIATGGMLPQGADACSMVEHTETLDRSTVMIKKPVSPEENIVRKGEDISKSSLFLRKGSVLRPSDIGALAALGICQVPVFRKPVVGIISSGDEIVPPENQVHWGQIRDINSYSIASAVESARAKPLLLGIAKDNYSSLLSKVKCGLEKADLIVVSGGSSVGTRDITARLFSDLGKVFVHGVAMRPGKPVIISSAGNKLLFGLPGHPVSALTTFNLFVEPAIEAMLNIPNAKDKDFFQPTIKARLSRNVSSTPGRQDYIRVRLFKEKGELWAEPILGKSALISTMVKAHGEIVVPMESEGLLKGNVIEVIPR
jgi:molybdopterin molybdotransferase